uniref:Movement protein TGBp3 n=1 Tax=Cherry rusty mottle associated virus TaxID=1312929 RepID=M9QTV1_9VIRU|nr:triple gene block 3 [Cherry rusty mottle associated virus]QTH26257.1 triple gene block protein 3 [Cherry rusty mottle associated virus]
MSVVNVTIGLVAFIISACIITIISSNSNSVCTIVVTGERAVVSGCEITQELSNLLAHLKPHTHSLGF